jgi:isopenicillin N synthase-like dioxygenase
MPKKEIVFYDLFIIHLLRMNQKMLIRAAAHGDINLITLLMGAQGKGLQVQNHNGDWIDAIAEPDELMINVGDMLSTTHE